MAYTIGASHGPFTGTGSFVIAKPAGIRTIVTNIPAWTGHENESPRRYFRLGRFTLGNSHGFSESQLLEYAQQLAYPIAPIWELLAYDINDGASCTFYELVAVPDLTALQPWDRTPSHWGSSFAASVTQGAGSTTGLSYTVPTGRKMLLERLAVRINRETVATTPVVNTCQATVNGNLLLNARLSVNTVGGSSLDSLDGSGLWLLPGATISIAYQGLDTGGIVNVYGYGAGLLFDA